MLGRNLKYRWFMLGTGQLELWIILFSDSCTRVPNITFNGVLAIEKKSVYRIMMWLESMIKFGKVESKGPSLAFESLRWRTNSETLKISANSVFDEKKNFFFASHSMVKGIYAISYPKYWFRHRIEWNRSLDRNYAVVNGFRLGGEISLINLPRD